MEQRKELETQLEEAERTFELHEPALRLIARLSDHMDFSSDKVAGLKGALREYDAANSAPKVFFSTQTE